MPAGLLVAIFLLAPSPESGPATPETAPAYGPVAGAPGKPSPPRIATPKTDEPCRTTPPSADATEIVVCAERPQGYRLNPDVRKAKRELRNHPKRRTNVLMTDTNCASVGPAGCMNAPGINIIGAALTAVEMAQRAARGENVGNMFITRPEASEYELYLETKRQREAEQAAQAAMALAKAKAAAAAKAAGGAPAKP